jgi:hypothetical protein
MVFPLESHIYVCETSSPGICVMTSPSFMHVKFPSNKDLLEDMFMDPRPPPKLEDLQVGFQ